VFYYVSYLYDINSNSIETLLSLLIMLLCGADLRVAEIKAALTRDKDDSVAETKRQFEAERDRAVQQAIQLTKKKPWVSACCCKLNLYIADRKIDI
jgi:hypothetical protein